MKRAVALICLVAGCSIPGDRFFKPGGGADGGADSSGGTDGKPADAPVNPAMKHGFIVDTQAGIFPVNKDPDTGALMVAGGVVAGGNPFNAVTNKQGTHLFVIDGSDVRDFTIGANGTSLTQVGTVAVTGCTAMWFSALHPTGKYLAVACANNRFAIVHVDANGALTTADTITTSGSTVLVPAWTPNGNCLFFADLNGGTTPILMYRFDATTGVPTSVGSQTAPSGPRGIAIHPNGLFLYEAGTFSPPLMQAFSITTSCTLTPIGSTLPAASNGGPLTVDPMGRFLFETGTQVDAYKIATDGTLTTVTGSPFIQTGTTMDGAIFDPAVPDLLYITGRGYGGTFSAPIAADGSVSMGTTASTGGGGSYWFALAP